MIEGVFRKVVGAKAIGWASDPDSTEPVMIEITDGQKVIAAGRADRQRKQASGPVGMAGFTIALPSGRKVSPTLDVYANGVKLPRSPQLQRRMDQTHRTLRLKIEDPHFFIHIPKTAGTAYRLLLKEYFTEDDFFPSDELLGNNYGLYSKFGEIIKWNPPEISPRLVVGHYPFATRQIIEGKVSKTVILRDPVQRAISNIFHMKNNDPRMTAMSPMEIYTSGRKNYVNFQIRYLTDEGIHLNMRFVDDKPLTEKDLRNAVANLRKCDVVGISDQLERTVALSNAVYDWELQAPGRVNMAKSEKRVSGDLLDLIVQDNALEQKLFEQASNRFEKLCAKHGV